MRWKYFCRWNCRKYDNVRYITCKSLYKDTKDKNTKEKIAKDKFQETKESKKNIRQAAGGYLKTSSCNW